MRYSKCIMTPGVTHLSFWEQPLVKERHVLRYEYKWAHLSFSRNNWICYIYRHICMVIAWYRHIQQVCKALPSVADPAEASPPPPYFTIKLRPEGPKNIFWRPRPPPPFSRSWWPGWPLLDVLSTFGLRPQSCMYLVGGLLNLLIIWWLWSTLW